MVSSFDFVLSREWRAASEETDEDVFKLNDKILTSSEAEAVSSKLNLCKEIKMFFCNFYSYLLFSLMLVLSAGKSFSRIYLMKRLRTICTKLYVFGKNSAHWTFSTFLKEFSDKKMALLESHKTQLARGMDGTWGGCHNSKYCVDR